MLIFRRTVMQNATGEFAVFVDGEPCTTPLMISLYFVGAKLVCAKATDDFAVFVGAGPVCTTPLMFSFETTIGR